MGAEYRLGVVGCVDLVLLSRHFGVAVAVLCLGGQGLDDDGRVFILGNGPEFKASGESSTPSAPSVPGPACKHQARTNLPGYLPTTRATIKLGTNKYVT